MDNILAAAQTIATARRNRTPLASLPSDLVPDSEAEGYQIQRVVHDLLLPQTGALVGYKIGCTSAVMQQYLDIPHPCGGGVFAKGVHDSGAKLRFGDYIRVGVECEIARESQGDFAFDADADVILKAQRRAAVVHALGEHAAAAGMRDVEISLHHLAGAADLVTDERAELGRQQVVDGILNQIAVGFGLRRGFAR